MKNKKNKNPVSKKSKFQNHLANKNHIAQKHICDSTLKAEKRKNDSAEKRCWQNYPPPEPKTRPPPPNKNENAKHTSTRIKNT